MGTKKRQNFERRCLLCGTSLLGLEKLNPELMICELCADVQEYNT